MTRFVSNREIYEQVIRDRVPLAKRRLWIATADIKDMYVDSSGRDMGAVSEGAGDLDREGCRDPADPCEGAGPELPRRSDQGGLNALDAVRGALILRSR